MLELKKSFGRDTVDFFLTNMHICIHKLPPVGIKGEVMAGQVLLQKPTMFQSLNHLSTIVFQKN